MSDWTPYSTTSATSCSERPDVLEVDVVAVGVRADRRPRSGSQAIDPGQRVGDHERRRREVVHLHVGVDAALEVAVARQHGDDREVLVVDDLGDLVRQRPGVADAGRAAVADEVEAERLERLDEPGALVVLGDDLRARRQRRLDPRLARQALLDRVAGEQAGARSSRDGFEVFVHDVIAAITTWPWSSVVSVPSVERDRDRRLLERHGDLLGRRAAPPARCARRRRGRRSTAGRTPGRTRRSPRRGRPAATGRPSRSAAPNASRASVSDDAVLRALRARRATGRRRRGRARARR